MARVVLLLSVLAVASATSLYSSLDNFEIAKEYLLVSWNVMEASGALRIRELVKGVPKGADPSSPPKYIVIDNALILGRGVMIEGKIYTYMASDRVLAFIRDSNSTKTSSMGSKAPAQKRDFLMAKRQVSSQEGDDKINQSRMK